MHALPHPLGFLHGTNIYLLWPLTTGSHESRGFASLVHLCVPSPVSHLAYMVSAQTQYVGQISLRTLSG